MIIDCIIGGEEEAFIIIDRVFPNYELQCLRASKKFMSDTLSRKENMECLIYDENNNKYRLNWNENYGELDQQKLFEKKLKIKYFKRSKIIFSCDIIE